MIKSLYKERESSCNYSHLKELAAELLHEVPPDSQNIYVELITALKLQYGDKRLHDVHYDQLKVDVVESAATAFRGNPQEFEANVDLLMRWAYSESPVDFRAQLALLIFIDGVRDSELQKVL